MGSSIFNLTSCGQKVIFGLLIRKRRISRFETFSISRAVYILAQELFFVNVQVALKTIFRFKKEMLNASKKVKIATLEELKNSQFEKWLEIV